MFFSTSIVLGWTPSNNQPSSSKGAPARPAIVGSLRLSTTSTFHPNLASAAPENNPAGPAPIMTTSYFSLSIVLFGSGNSFKERWYAAAFECSCVFVAMFVRICLGREMTFFELTRDVYIAGLHVSVGAFNRKDDRSSHWMAQSTPRKEFAETGNRL